MVPEGDLFPLKRNGLVQWEGRDGGSVNFSRKFWACLPSGTPPHPPEGTWLSQE